MQQEEYYKKSIGWYSSKYTEPFVMYSWLIIMLICTCVCCFILFISLFGVAQSDKIYYWYHTNNIGSIGIKNMYHIMRDGKQHSSIREVVVNNYITQRESYNIGRMENQYKYIKNNSSQQVYNAFKQYFTKSSMSPYIRYGDFITRDVKILSSKINGNHATVYFRTIANDFWNNAFEDILWKSEVEYEYSFSVEKAVEFKVTKYNIELIKNYYEK